MTVISWSYPLAVELMCNLEQQEPMEGAKRTANNRPRLDLNQRFCLYELTQLLHRPAAVPDECLVKGLFSAACFHCTTQAFGCKRQGRWILYKLAGMEPNFMR